MAIKFTKVTIDQIPVTEKRQLIYEENGKGLAVRVTPAGTKTFVHVYRFEGKLKFYTIGKTTDVSLKDARKISNEVRNKALEGKDPSLEKQLAKINSINDPTFESLANEYIEKYAKKHKKTWKKDQQMLKADVLPKWKKRKASSIKRREVVLLLEEIVDRGAPIAANRTFALIRRIYNFAIERDIIQHTPCVGVKMPSKENKRDRVLNEQEIRSIWHGLDNATMSPEVKILLKLMLVTGQRKGEWAKARWEEINFKTNWWVIPAINSKNGVTHTVYLSPLALELLTELRALNPKSEWLFPSPKGVGHITLECIPRAISRNTKVFEGVGSWVAHDLRRTAATHMSAMGVSRFILQKILNHTDSSVTAVYDRHSYDDEKTESLILWGDKLRVMIASWS